MKILAWGVSDAGTKREHNEDSYLVSDDFSLFAVADGMGGHAGGARASTMAVEILRREVTEGLPKDEKAPENGSDSDPPALRVMREAATSAGRQIFDAAQKDPQFQGMGTTLTGLLVHGDHAYMAHVGDSRAYVFRDGRLRQLTEDHSWVYEQTKAGYLTFDEARTSKFRHVITRSVGYEREVEVDVTSFPVLMGDCYLLCSDGLSSVVENDDLTKTLTHSYYRAAPKALINLANDRGSDDNITAVVVYAANAT